MIERLTDLGRLIVADAGLKLLSMLLALVTWLYVQSLELVVDTARVFVEPTFAQGFTSIDPIPGTVSVELRGPRAAVNRALNANLTLELDLSREQVGPGEFSLVTYPIRNLPQNVAAQDFTPDRLMLRIDEETTRNLKVEPSLFPPRESSPYVVEDVTLTPDVAEVAGPRAVLEGMTVLRIQQLDLTDWTASGEIDVTLDLPRGVREKTPWLGRASIEIGSKTTTRTLRDVEVFVTHPDYVAQTPRIAVLLHGPATSLRNIRLDKVKVFLELPADASADRYVVSYGSPNLPRMDVLHPGGENVEVDTPPDPDHGGAEDALRFGTDGIRGPAGREPIGPDGAARVGIAAWRWAREQGDDRVIVLRDTRPSGEELARHVAEGVVAAGGRALMGGVLPTSALALGIDRGMASSGVMVTASHNPASDNGFKVLGPGGHKPDDARTATLERWVAEASPGRGAGTIHDVGPPLHAAYVEALEEASRPREVLGGRRVLVDLAHGALTAAWPEPLEGWGLHAMARGDGLINDGVGSEHLSALADAVRQGDFDAGIAVDGDADRCVLVDERGTRVDGDALTWLLARHRGLRRLAVTVMSSSALEAALPGVSITRTPVGDRHLAAALAEGAELGAETSGHVLFADGLPGGDGLLTGLRALDAAWAAATTVAQAVSGFTPFPRRLTKITVRRRPPLDEVPELVSLVRAGEAQLGEGRVFLRYSGTEPVLRVLVEGRDRDVVAAVSVAVTAGCGEVLG